MFSVLKRKKYILLRNELSCIGKSALLRVITSEHHGDFYCLHCLHTFATKSKLKFHKNLCENKDFCNVNMPYEDIKY